MRLYFLTLPAEERRLYIEQAATRRNVSPPDGTALVRDPTNKEAFEEDVCRLFFASVWEGMSDELYFDETIGLLAKRFELNGISPHAFFGGNKVLDGGCGSGKFSCAIARLGASHVTGIDLSKQALDFARRQADRGGLKGRTSIRRDKPRPPLFLCGLLLRQCPEWVLLGPLLLLSLLLASLSAGSQRRKLFC
jgi:SAM-dependent methyltransferase